MKTKTKKAPKRATIEAPKTCGECARGEWNMENLNYKGCPFLIYCEHTDYARQPNNGRRVCFDSTPACDKFTPGTKKGGRV